MPNSATVLVLREDCYQSSHDWPVTVHAGYVRWHGGRQTHHGDSLVLSTGMDPIKIYILCVLWSYIVPSIPFLWTHNFYFLQKTWAHVQTRRSYPEFVAEFDRLTPRRHCVVAIQSFGYSRTCTAWDIFGVHTGPEPMYDYCSFGVRRCSWGPLPG